MSNTIRTADDVLRSLMMQRTPAERMHMCARMFSSAKLLAEAGITMEAGALDDAELRRSLFLRFYANEFTEPERKSIIERILA